MGEVTMETVKVDVRKLQILNDRINQAIEALGQLRLSVHGLQHAAPAWPLQAQAQAPIGYPQLQHAAPVWPLQAQAQAQAPIGYPQPGIGYGAIGVAPQAPWAFPFAGLAHSTPEAIIDPRHAQQDPYVALRLAQDPYAAIRYLQTFPYLYAVVPPLAASY